MSPVTSHRPGVTWGLPNPVSFEESRYLVAVLTAREYEIAGLVSAGLSNRDIADALFVSTRTVEYHIVAIYQKWGVHSRVQLANVFHSFNTGLAKATPENAKPTGEPETKNVQEPRLTSPEQIGDLTGYALKPDPLTAKSLTDLEKLLRDLWTWAGYPSSRILASRSGGAFSHATISKLIYDKPGKPNLKLPYVLGFVRACGGDQDEQKRWVTAWRNIVGESRAINPLVHKPPAAG